MAYTGSGTQADPWIVDNLYDLITCYNTTPPADNKIYIKLDADIDCNDYPEYRSITGDQESWFKVKQENEHVYVDMQGHEFTNIFMFDTSNYNSYFIYIDYNRHCEWSNGILEIVNINMSQNHGIHNYNNNYSSHVKFVNMDFRIKEYHYHTSSAVNLFQRPEMFNCVVNVDWYRSNNSQSGSVVIYENYKSYFNEFNIRVIYIGASNYGDRLSLAFSSGGDNSHFFSSIFLTTVCIKANDGYICIQNNRSKQFNNCYFICRNTTAYKALKFYFCTGGSCDVGSVNFYDAEVIPAADIDVSMVGGTLLALDTAHCKNAQYLEQQGFVIAYDGGGS